MWGRQSCTQRQSCTHVQKYTLRQRDIAQTDLAAAFFNLRLLNMIFFHYSFSMQFSSVKAANTWTRQARALLTPLNNFSRTAIFRVNKTFQQMKLWNIINSEFLHIIQIDQYSSIWPYGIGVHNSFTPKSERLLSIARNPGW